MWYTDCNKNKIDIHYTAHFDAHVHNVKQVTHMCVKMCVEGGGTMNITEFARSRDIEAGTVRMYISRNKELFDGHTKKGSKSVELDEIALELLEKKYPLPKPVEVVQGIDRKEFDELQQKYMNALEEINNLQKQIVDATKKVAIAETQQLLMEDRTKQLEEQKEDNKVIKRKLEEERRKNKDLEDINRKIGTDSFKNQCKVSDLESKLKAREADLKRTEQRLNDVKEEAEKNKYVKTIFGLYRKI